MEFRTDRYKLKDIFPQKAGKYAQKLHKKADQIDFVRKMIPIEPEEIEVKDGERSVIRLITTPHLDRDSDILIPSGAILDDFRASPSVLFGHDYKSLPVAKDLWIKKTNKGILTKSQYDKHAFAQDLYESIKGGFTNSNSVGFIPVETISPEDKKEFNAWQEVLEKEYEIDKEESGKAKAIYSKWILLEHSDVPIASNAQSLNLAVAKGDLPIYTDKFKKEFGIEEPLAPDLTEAKDYEDIDDVADAVEKEEDIPDFQEDETEEAVGNISPVEDVSVDVETEKKDEAIKESIKEVLRKNHNEEVKEMVVTGNGLDEQQAREEKVIEDIKDEGDNLPESLEGLEDEAEDDTCDECKETITKPETTESYHRIPINPGCEITATITVSASKGIKGLYCGKEKKIHTYLFDVNKWSMSEAQQWVKDNKKMLERFEQKLASKEADEDLVLFHVDLETGLNQGYLKSDFTGEEVEDIDKDIQDIINGKQLDEIESEEKQSQEIEIEGSTSDEIEIEDYNMTKDKTIEIDGVEEEEKQRDELVPEETFTCECPKCGHKALAKPGQACKDMKCPECGSSMRQAKQIEEIETEDEKIDTRDSCGTALGMKDDDWETDKEPDDEADVEEQKRLDKLEATVRITDLPEFKAIIAELKEGRILSSKNRTLVKETMDTLQKLLERLQKLYQATEPTPQMEELRSVETEEIEIEDSEAEGEAEKDEVLEAVKEALKTKNLAPVIGEAIEENVKVELARLKGKVIVEDEDETK